MPELSQQPPDVYTLLAALADRIDGKYRNAAMDEPLALAQALVVAERAPGSTDAAERALTDALPPVRTGDTRADYAARVRLLAEGVTA
ncbi:hypothetical protein ACGFY0_45290 [Streptomyces chartreusis]|uniref:hypothetical protein n=1 Tax=Streptomyces chartreusis TaxID=1969 RepID=UPI00371A640A